MIMCLWMAIGWLLVGFLALHISVIANGPEGTFEDTTPGFVWAFALSGPIALIGVIYDAIQDAKKANSSRSI